MWNSNLKLSKGSPQRAEDRETRVGGYPTGLGFHVLLNM